MALPELAVMQQTFELLHQLDPKARRRVLKWVKAALDEAGPVPVSAPAEPAEARQATEPADAGVADESVAAADTAVEPAAAEAGTAGEPAADTAGADPAGADPAGADPAGADTAGADTAGEPVSAGTGEAPADDQDGAGAPATPSPAAGRSARRAAKTAAKPARGRAKPKTAAPAAEAAPAAGGRGRPPADEIMRVYQQVNGKLTELAKHYGKPYGTIQGWASTLREQGYPIGRSRKS